MEDTGQVGSNPAQVEPQHSQAQHSPIAELTPLAQLEPTDAALRSPAPDAIADPVDVVPELPPLPVAPDPVAHEATRDLPGQASEPANESDENPASDGFLPPAGDLRPVWPASDAQAKGIRSRGRAGVVAQVSATLAAALFFFVAWTPWANAITSGDLRIAASGPAYRFSLTAAELGAPPLHDLPYGSFFPVWSALTVLGLLLCPLLWQTSIRWVRWAGAALYACWLIAVGIVSIGTAVLILSDIPARLAAGLGPYQITLSPYSEVVAIYKIDPAFGLWLAPVALALGVVAGVAGGLALWRPARVKLPTAPASVQAEIVSEAQPAPSRSLPGAGVITGGLILWAWGFFLLPWAIHDCARMPLLAASCEGLPVTSALQVGLGVARSFFDPSAALYSISGLLLVGAVLILVGVWSRDITRTLCFWATLWLAAALTGATLAIVGAQQVVSNAASVGLPAGQWRGDTGVLIVFLALLLVAIGLVPLWAIAQRRARRRAAALRAAGL